MTKAMKIAVIVVLVAVVGVVFALKRQNQSQVSGPAASASPNPSTTETKPQNPENTPGTETAVNLPRLLDLGADKCIPCKMMAPILEELKTRYRGKLRVDFIDVWKNPGEAEKSGIRVIPTQIFYDASGKELYRHEGFFSKEDILAKWKEFGIDLEK